MRPQLLKLVLFLFFFSLVTTGLMASEQDYDPLKLAREKSAILINPEAVIPSQCYTKTEGKNNPCWVCHTEKNGANLADDWELQEEYAFSDPGLAYGMFHATAVPIRLYGAVTNRVNYQGFLMDIGHHRRLAVAKDNDRESWVSYNNVRGQQASAFEHKSPEQFFSLSDSRVEGVSAMKAISIAMSEGQRIYTLSAENQEALQNLYHSQSVMDDVRNALALGMEVRIHESPIQKFGFHGAGYIITDPETGGGMYLIEGGNRGGELRTTGSGNLQAIAVALALFGGISFSVAAILAGGAGLIVLLPIVISAITLIYVSIAAGNEVDACEGINLISLLLTVFTPLASGGSKIAKAIVHRISVVVSLTSYIGCRV